MPDDRRDHDLVLVGATGFTGGLTAEYLARHAPAGLRWALAGRSPDKLATVRDRLAGIDPALADLPLLTADVSDPASLRAVAESARVVVTTVGPYLEHGEPLVAACAEAGTDYADLTGEPEFVDRMYLAHHARAVETGARLVHCCGFDSIPHDLGVLLAVQQLPADAPKRVYGVVRSAGTFSGGTFASALNQMGRARQLRSASAERRRAEGRPEGRRVRSVAERPHHDAVTGYWLVPLPTIDPAVVARSARALPSYGPEFTYGHYAGTKKLLSAAVGIAGVGAMVGVAQVPPLRRLLVSRVPQGSGPDEARRERSWFTVDVVAEAVGQQVRVRVSGGDPGYTETARMLAESAMSLALDHNPPTSGQVTTAVAMGDNLLRRLRESGMGFEVLEPGQRPSRRAERHTSADPT